MSSRTWKGMDTDRYPSLWQCTLRRRSILLLENSFGAVGQCCQIYVSFRDLVLGCCVMLLSHARLTRCRARIVCSSYLCRIILHNPLVLLWLNGWRITFIFDCQPLKRLKRDRSACLAQHVEDEGAEEAYCRHLRLVGYCMMISRQPLGVDVRAECAVGVATVTGKISVLSSLFFFGFGSGAIETCERIFQEP